MSRDYAKYRGDHEHGGSSVKIFLSHAGADAADARRLADKLWDRLRRNSPDVAVFCTSQPEDRMPDPLLSIRPGQNFEMEARAAIERLRDYLRENIVTSQAYLVLVTRRSLEESRPWVRWEILEAQAMAKDQTLRFIPCLLDVPSRTLQSMVTALIKSEWEEWEVGAIPDSSLRPYEFQGVDVSSPRGLEELALALETIDHVAAEPAD
jgi:hypothetical protein